MLRPLDRSYVPFGTQYYRAPSPKSGEWERDIAVIARLGMNTIKFWVQWRWNNPSEGGFMFDDIDRLMDLAGRNGLKVTLNTIVDVAPAWIFRKYPDVSMVTLDGRTIGPQVQPHRQIGGLGACLNHAPAMAHMFEFMRTTVRRYKDHPALAMWNVASEPELTQSMAEMRLYADHAGTMGDMLCYCDKCRVEFIAWLQKKYDSIDRLNRSWNRNYDRFEHIELPRTRNSFNDVIDWRMFFVDVIGDNVRRRFAIAREEDERHPLLCHHVFLQGFPVTSTANDPWNVGQYGDLHGITQMDDPMMCDVLRSCARGKPVISAEMLMLYGYTLDLSPLPTPDDIKRNIFNGVAANLKGFIFWQYRPETLAREAPAWGLTRLDGSMTPWLKAFAECGKVLQANAEFLHDAAPRKAEVALLYSPENQVFGWVATGNEKSVTDSLLGMHRALYERNHVLDLIHEKELAAELDHYRVLVVPFPYHLHEESCRILSSWVERGGTLIAEAYCAGWNPEEGEHQTTVPGFGLDKVFRAHQIAATRANPAGDVPLSLLVALPFSPAGRSFSGSMVQESLETEGGEVLATFENGDPAITRAPFGKGTAILIGTYVAMPFSRGIAPGNGDLIAGLVESAVKGLRPSVEENCRVRVDVLEDSSGSVMVILRNLESRPVQTTVTLPGVRSCSAVELFTERKLRLVSGTGSATGVVRLDPLEVQVYRA